MTVSITAPGNSLHGKNILLSASIPDVKRGERYHRVHDAGFQIDQAVISLARAVFSEGGRLVFGGQPAISSLVAMVVGEYRVPRFLESTEERQRAPVDIYQSRAFEGYLPDDTLLMYRLGYAFLHWVDGVDNERFDPNNPREDVPCPRSLRRMRKTMLETAGPDAMVCIGGMEGLEEEVELALASKRYFPIYVLEKTGGAAALLRGRHTERLRMIDTEIIMNLDQMRAELGNAKRAAEFNNGRALVPYPLVMQTIVEEVASQR